MGWDIIPRFVSDVAGTWELWKAGLSKFLSSFPDHFSLMSRCAATSRTDIDSDCSAENAMAAVGVRT